MIRNWYNQIPHPYPTESSLSVRRYLGSFATQWAHSEDSDQTGRMPSFAVRTWFCWLSRAAAQVLFFVWFLFSGPSTHFRSFRARSVTLTTQFLGKPPMQFTSLSPVTDNCSSWISERGRMAVEFFFTTKSSRKYVPDVGIELGAACMPSGHASDRATAPGCGPIVFF